MPDEIKSGIRLRENTYEAEIKQRKKSIFIFDICRTIDAFLFSSNSHPADLWNISYIYRLGWNIQSG